MLSAKKGWKNSFLPWIFGMLRLLEILNNELKDHVETWMFQNDN